MRRSHFSCSRFVLSEQAEAAPLPSRVVVRGEHVVHSAARRPLSILFTAARCGPNCDTTEMHLSLVLSHAVLHAQSGQPTRRAVLAAGCSLAVQQPVRALDTRCAEESRLRPSPAVAPLGASSSPAVCSPPTAFCSSRRRVTRRLRPTRRSEGFALSRRAQGWRSMKSQRRSARAATTPSWSGYDDGPSYATLTISIHAPLPSPYAPGLSPCRASGCRSSSAASAPSWRGPTSGRCST